MVLDILDIWVYSKKEDDINEDIGDDLIRIIKTTTGVFSKATIVRFKEDFIRGLYIV